MKPMRFEHLFALLGGEEGLGWLMATEAILTGLRDTQWTTDELLRIIRVRSITTASILGPVSKDAEFDVVIYGSRVDKDGPWGAVVIKELERYATMVVKGKNPAADIDVLEALRDEVKRQREKCQPGQEFRLHQIAFRISIDEWPTSTLVFMPYSKGARLDTLLEAV